MHLDDVRLEFSIEKRREFTRHSPRSLNVDGQNVRQADGRTVVRAIVAAVRIRWRSPIAERDAFEHAAVRCDRMWFGRRGRSTGR
jgi:hypothetical protein